MPRLSVDIDLTYLPIEDRTTTLANITIIMNNMLDILNKQPGVKAQLKKTKDGITKQILAMKDDTAVKIELNLVVRGSIYSPVNIELSRKAQNEFQKYMELKILSFEDLYGGKFCAALDRGHPRDLYDLAVFFQNHNIDEKLKNAFIFYLLSSNRPIAELLNPSQPYNLTDLYNNEFEGMVSESVSLEKLKQTYHRFIQEINSALNDQDKKFLFSFKKGDPIWDLFTVTHLKDLPSIKWKLYNIQNMPRTKHVEALEKLKNVLWK